MLNDQEIDTLKTLILAHGPHDVVLGLAIVCNEHAVSVRMRHKNTAKAKLWEYLGERFVELTNDDCMMHTR